MQVTVARKIGLVLLCSSLVYPFALSQESKPGVVVETVASQLEGDKAGLRSGDIILRWTRTSAQGAIECPFDLFWTEVEQAPRGPVVLEGVRGTDKLSWKMGPGKWGIEVRPQMSDSLVSLYRQGQQAAKAGKPAEAADSWKAAAGDAKDSIAIWLLFKKACTWAEARGWNDADKAYQEATAAASAAGPVIASELFRSWGDTYKTRSDWKNAEYCYQHSIEGAQKLGTENLEVAQSLNQLGVISYLHDDLAKADEYHYRVLGIRQRLAPDSPDLANTFDNLGRVSENRGDLAKAEEFFQQALNIRERRIPGSLDIAASLNNLGNVAFDRGALDRAEGHYRQALEIRQKWVPASLDVSDTLNNLGNVAYVRGDLAKAEEYYRQTLKMHQALAPSSRRVAVSLTNLGLVAADGGDPTKAEEFYRQALDLDEKLAPGGLDVATDYIALGDVALNQGDLAKAEDYQRRALAIGKKLAPESILVAWIFNNLGNVHGHRGDWQRAEEFYQKSLDIRQKLAPGSLDVAVSFINLGEAAWRRRELRKAEEYGLRALNLEQKLAPRSMTAAACLNNLGVVARSRGDLVKAEEYFLQALDIPQKLAPESMTAAAAYNNLGDVAKDRKNLAKAEDFYRQALAIRSKLAPQSQEYAESLASLAGVLRSQGQSDSAERFYEQALNVLEGQTAHLGGAEETRSNFRASHASYFVNYIDLLMQQKKPDLAFQVAERWRARSLLDILAGAHVDIRQGVEPDLRARERSLEGLLNAKSDRRIRLLTADRRDEKQIEDIEKEISDLRNQYSDLQGRIRAASPVYAALTHPQPVNAAEARQLLDDDTVLLEYSLGEERSYLWAITRDSLHGYQLPPRSKIEALARQWHRLVSSLASPSQAKGGLVPTRSARLRIVAAALSRMVIAPVAGQTSGKRLLIVGDGALQYVPFAALPVPGNRSGVPLIVEHEIVSVPSASVLAELRREATTHVPAPKAVAVFADPVFDSEDPRVPSPGGRSHPNPASASHGFASLENEGLTRSVGDVGLAHLSRLAFSRREADAIMAVTPSGQGKAALGFDADRATATAPELAQYRIVHFSTHALSDNRRPELSGLVLSLVDRKGKPQDGFLDLQSIYNLQLPAELVVLSACETGLGKEVAGEGLVGLTRAFMYAGAARIVASLWSVNDVSTKELMERFYWAMEHDGMRPAPALRAAQVALWRKSRWRDPYYWAAFEIQGEWK